MDSTSLIFLCWFWKQIQNFISQLQKFLQNPFRFLIPARHHQVSPNLKRDNFSTKRYRENMQVCLKWQDCLGSASNTFRPLFCSQDHLNEFYLIYTDSLLYRPSPLEENVSRWTFVSQKVIAKLAIAFFRLGWNSTHSQIKFMFRIRVNGSNRGSDWSDPLVEIETRQNTNKGLISTQRTNPSRYAKQLTLIWKLFT